MAALSVMTCCAGHTYTSLHAEGGNQGMLVVCLLDKESSQVICVVNTHLKAKAGSKNDAIRDHQVGTVVLCCFFWPSVTLHSSTSLAGRHVLASQTIELTACCACVSCSSLNNAGAVSETRSPVDMLQAQQLLEDVQQAVNSVSGSSSTANSSGLDTQQHKQRAPLVILCGDLNTTPDSATCQVHYPSLLPGCHCACSLAEIMLAHELFLDLLAA